LHSEWLICVSQKDPQKPRLKSATGQGRCYVYV